MMVHITNLRDAVKCWSASDDVENIPKLVWILQSWIIREYIMDDRDDDYVFTFLYSFIVLHFLKEKSYFVFFKRKKLWEKNEIYL